MKILSLPGLNILKTNFFDLTSIAIDELKPGRHTKLSAFWS